MESSQNTEQNRLRSDSSNDIEPVAGNTNEAENTTVANILRGCAFAFSVLTCARGSGLEMDSPAGVTLESVGKLDGGALARLSYSGSPDSLRSYLAERGAIVVEQTPDGTVRTQVQDEKGFILTSEYISTKEPAFMRTLRGQGRQKDGTSALDVYGLTITEDGSYTAKNLQPSGHVPLAQYLKLQGVLVEETEGGGLKVRMGEEEVVITGEDRDALVSSEEVKIDPALASKNYLPKEVVQTIRKKIELSPKEKIINSGYNKYEYSHEGKTVFLYSQLPIEEISQEHHLVNALFVQQDIAKRFGAEKEMYDSLHLDWDVSPSLMTAGSSIINMNALQQDLEVVKGNTDKEIAIYTAGQIFHEVMHDPDDVLRKETDIFRGGKSTGEITSITGQTALCLSEGYFGRYTYDTGRADAGMRRLREEGFSEVSYDSATVISATLIRNRLVQRFPDYAEGTQTLDPVTACKEICKRIPNDRKAELDTALKDAIADSGNKQIIDKAALPSKELFEMKI